MRVARLRTHLGDRFARLSGTRAHGFDRAPWAGGRETGDSWDWREDDLRCPVMPTKIVAVGRNYAAHAKELGNELPTAPLLFLKPPSALIGPRGVVRLPPESSRVEHEAELAVVIGRGGRAIAEGDALGCVFGYSAACDVTARDLQRKDVQFTRAKGFDTFCPMGPWIETDLDPRQVRVACRVDGQIRQDGSTKDMVFSVAKIVSYVSGVMTLEPGDVILTGTPEGVGALAAGNALEIDIGGVGTLAVGVEG